MTSKQKIKGNNWERDCAEIFSEVFGEHFHRNISGSGNFLGGSNSFRKKIVSQSMITTNRGDIVCPDDMPHLVIECKSYKEFPFHHLLINKEIPDLRNWIEQQYEVVDENDFWCICFKITRMGSYIAVPLKHCDFVDDKLGNYSIYYHNNGEKFIITEFEPFIKLYTEEIRKKCL